MTTQLILEKKYRKWTIKIFIKAYKKTNQQTKRRNIFKKKIIYKKINI